VHRVGEKTANIAQFWKSAQRVLLLKLASKQIREAGARQCGKTHSLQMVSYRLFRIESKGSFSLSTYKKGGEKKT